MTGDKEGRREDAFNKYLASAVKKGIELEGSGALVAALAEFEKALEVKPNSRPVLECCAMVRFMLGDRSATRELHIRASRNQDGEVSDAEASVLRLVRTEYMKWSMFEPMMGKPMEVKYEKTLPDLPPKFQRNSGPQVFTGVFHFIPTVERVADEVVLTMTLDHVEIGVSNFVTECDFQGYFIHAYEIGISPSTLWKSKARLATVKARDSHLSQQLVQQQQTSGYAARVGVGGANIIPNITAQYSTSVATSTFTGREVMTVSNDDENVMKCAWMVKTYEDGRDFVIDKPVWEIHKLPYPPKKHGFSTPFQGTWVIPLNVAVQLEYKFEWKIQLKAKFVLFPRTLKRKCLKKWPLPLPYDFEPHFSVETSDFAGASTARMFQF